MVAERRAAANPFGEVGPGVDRRRGGRRPSAWPPESPARQRVEQ